MPFRIRGAVAGILGALSLGLPFGVWGGTDLESGRYLTGSLATNYPIKPFYFQATSGDVVIVRVANEDTSYPHVPDVNIYTWPGHVAVTSVSDKFTVHDVTLAVTNFSWFEADCVLPASLSAISNTLSFSISMLRLPSAPLCTEDPDIGNLESGESLAGTIHVGADLDAAFVSVTNPCRLILRMGQITVDLVSSIKLYDPAGNVVAADFPPEYRSEVSAWISATGRYTVVYNDLFNSRGGYAVSLARVPGEVAASDQDIGPIINGETRTGTINNPGDLDVASFTAQVGDTNILTMTKIDADMNPRLELYDPSGSNCLAAPVDPYQASVSVTTVCAAAGTYTLVCKDAEDRSSKRYTLSMTTLGGPSAAMVPDPPAILSASDGVHTNVIMVTWESVTNASGYDLWRSDGTNTAVYAWLVTNTTYTYYQDGGVTQNVAYTYKAKARNAYGASAFSTTDMGYCGAVPAAPSGLAASDGTFSNYILVSWQAATNASRYDLWRTASTDSTAYALLITNHPDTYYRDSNVVFNLSYNYKVQGRNLCGPGEFSASDPGYCGVSGTSSNRRALLVGLDSYGYGPSPLDTCTNDAVGLRDILLLGDPSNRWAATNLTTLLDAQATKTAIRDRLHAMAAQSGSGDLVMYAHSSHGGYSGSLSNTFLCSYDADYTDTELAADLTFFRPDVRIIVILDACYSGGMYQLSAGGAPTWPFAERVMAEYLRLQTEPYRRKGLAAPKGLGTNIAFMTACKYDETSQTYGYYSLYMGFLIRGCGNSSVDDNGDGEYQFSELHNYAAAHALEINPNQNAQTYNPTLLQTTAARAVGSASGVSFDTHNDYDGDRHSDLALYHEASGSWYVYSVKRGVLLATNVVFGGPGWRALTGDYDGDGKADLALYAEQTGRWRIGSLARWTPLAWDAAWGGPGQRPVVGDYDGDGYDDGALYAAADGFWYVANTFGRILVYGDSFAGAGFTAVPGDYNGDGIADYALYHNSQGYWYILSHAGDTLAWGVNWGAWDYAPVSGDFDGDGKSDLAVYHEASGVWYVWSLGRERAIASGIQYGGPGRTPVPGDYNGDRKAEIALYEQSTGTWYIRTLDGTQEGVFLFGHPSYAPVKPCW